MAMSFNEFISFMCMMSVIFSRLFGYGYGFSYLDFSAVIVRIIKFSEEIESHCSWVGEDYG